MKMQHDTGSRIDDRDRRPIRSRELGVMRAAADRLATLGVSPNTVSVMSMLFALAGTAMMLLAGATGGWTTRLCCIAAAVCIQLRLLANLFDGMVAQAAGKASPSGRLLNEWPDRVSDTLLLIGFGWLAIDPTSRWLGPAAACVAVMTAYVRELARAVDAPQCFHGPMAKPQRMAVLTAALLTLAIWPGLFERSLVSTRPSIGFVDAVLGLVILGGVATVFRRLRIIHRHAAQQGGGT